MHQLIQFVRAWIIAAFLLACLPLGECIAQVSTFTSTDVPKAINDFQTVDSVLPIAADFKVCDLNVSVNITHTWRGDLQVSLISPSGKTVFLHNRTGFDADNVIWTYDQGTLNPDGPGSLDDLVGMSTLGTWRLRIFDNAGGDVGTLNSWSLIVTPGSCTAPPPPPPDYAFGPIQQCAGSTVALVAGFYSSVNNFVLDWYANSCGAPGAYLGTSVPSSYFLTPLDATTKFWVRTVRLSDHAVSACRSVTVTAVAPNYPTALALSRDSINYHDQGSILLTLVGGDVDAVDWFEGTAPERFIARTYGRKIRVPSPVYPTMYTARLTPPCGVSAKTLSVHLHVVNPDVNTDGFIDFEDFDAFVGLLEAGDPNADFNRDGFLTFEDFDEFVATFVDGGCFLPNCPCDQTIAGPYTNPYGDPYGDPYCPWCPYGGEPGLGGEYGCPSYRLSDAARGGIACPVNSEYLMGKADQRMAMAAGLMSLAALGFTSVSRRRP